jgi:hypothetical protein
MVDQLLDARSMFVASAQDAGLGDETSPEIRARFEGVVDVMNDAIGDLSVEIITARLRRVLDRRLAMVADRMRFPGLTEVPIEQPIFVVGFARTGTTLLHCLLAELPGCRAPMLWETRNPSPPPRSDEDEVARIRFGDLEAQFVCEHVPGILAAHPYFDMGGRVPIEDEEILTLDFQNAYPNWYPEGPLVMDIGAQDPGSGYRFHREFLQQLQFERSPARWVLKGTAHQFLLEQLWAEYPDARCVWTHRDPVETYGSMLELTAMVQEATAGPIDRPALAEGLLAGMRAGLDGALSSPFLDDPRLAHVRFNDLVADPVTELERLFKAWSLDWTSQHSGCARTWLDDSANRGDRHGRFTWSLESFDVTAEEIDRLFADYRMRFLGDGSGA